MKEWNASEAQMAKFNPQFPAFNRKDDEEGTAHRGNVSVDSKSHNFRSVATVAIVATIAWKS
jgi:hypothetical protein